MPYQTLNETRSGGMEFSSEVFSKFCSMGFVTSNTWSSTYVAVGDGFVRLYDKEETFRTNPENFVQEIYLDDGYGASDIKTKNYSLLQEKELMIHYMYVEVDNGFWAPTRIIKLGSFDARIMEKIRAAVDHFRALKKKSSEGAAASATGNSAESFGFFQ